MNKILTYNRWILAVLIFASLAMAGGMSNIRVSHKMDDYFSANGEDLRIYNDYREIFGDDDLFLLVAIESDRDIYENKFLRKLYKAKKEIAALDSVEQVLWFDNWLPKYARLTKELIEPIPEKGLFVSKDDRIASLVVRHKALTDKESIAKLVSGIKESLTDFEEDKLRLAGKVYFTTVLEEFMKEDSGLLFVITFALTLIILFLILGSIRLLLIGLLVPILSISFTLGLMGHLGFNYNLFTTMVPTLILIISVSDIIHITKGAGPAEGGKRVLYHFAALLLTSVTTSIGFGSLLTTQIPAIMEFGSFVAIGVMYTFVLTIVIFSMVPLEKYQKVTFTDRALNYLVEKITFLYKQRPVQIITFIGITAFILGGIHRVESNAYLISGVPDDSEIRQNSAYFNEHFSGTRPLSFFLEKKHPEQALDTTIFPRIDSLIKRYFHPGFLIGPEADPAIEIDEIKVSSEDRQTFRFYGLIDDIGSKIASQQYDSLKAAIVADPLSKALTFNYTGVSRMVDQNTVETSSSIMIGLFVALGITFILLAVFFGGMWEAFISLIVNVIPLLILASVYGFLGIELRAGTSVAFSIAFGIAIDDTMHMMATYKKHKLLGSSFDQVILDSGRPILMTTLVFGISFSVLTLSNMGAIHILGLSMVIGCAAALVSDLIILPALLSLSKK